jgi:pimeloyl-ACP methyl ester carboxylesterase
MKSEIRSVYFSAVVLLSALVSLGFVHIVVAGGTGFSRIGAAAAAGPVFLAGAHSYESRQGPFLLPAAQAGAPGYEPAACPMPAPEGARVECGYLTVPEDRSRPEGRTIRLAVAIVRSRSPDPAPDPVVYLEGGPGYGPLRNIENWLLSTLLDRRDLILIDQRGTGFSQPDLRCPEFLETWRETGGRSLSLEESVDLTVQATVDCRERLEAGGVNLSAYHTAASAADLEDLRLALGYPEWNLFGVSYGTRLALAAMRDFPEGIRSAVLDSVVPTQVNIYETDPERTAQAFERLFSGCAADPACQAAYPGLEARFSAGLERLNRQPVLSPFVDEEAGVRIEQEVNGDLLAVLLYGAMYETRLIPYLPLAVDQMLAGNRQVAGAIETELVAYFAGQSHGMAISVDCVEEIPFNDPQAIQRAVAVYPDLLKASVAPRGFLNTPAALEVCAAWGVEPSGPVENQPVESDIPTLVLAGEYDPVTPAEWSRLAARSLSRSYYFEFARAGHGITTIPEGCPRQVRNQFLEAPNVPPDPDCLAGEGPESRPFVTGVYLNRGVYRLATGVLLDPQPLPAGALAACLLGMLATGVGGPLAARRRSSRMNAADAQPTPALPAARMAALAHRLGWLAALVDLAFAACLGVFILRTAAQDETLLLFGLPTAAAPLFILPWVAALLAAGSLALAALSWRDLSRRRSDLAFTLASALAVLGFTAWLVYFGLV